MTPKGLEWAQFLRADLVARVENLEAALRDMEPLRQELDRLRAQLKGVERLIATYQLMGYKVEGVHAGADASLPAPELARPVLHRQAPDNVVPPPHQVEIPAFVYRSLILAGAAKRRAAAALALGWEAARRRLRAISGSAAKLRARLPSKTAWDGR